MASSYVLSISSQSFISLVREISVSKIKLCFPCDCNDIHINPTKCNVVAGTVLKYLGSPNLYFQAYSGSTWNCIVRCLLRGVLELFRISHWMWATCLSHSCSLPPSSTSEEPPMLCLFHSPSQSPSWCPCPAIPFTHHPSAASGIKTQDFFSDPAKLHILDGFCSKPGI